MTARPELAVLDTQPPRPGAHDWTSRGAPRSTTRTASIPGHMSAGGAVMPSYAEALSPEERWDVVNYLRTLAKR